MLIKRVILKQTIQINMDELEKMEGNTHEIIKNHEQEQEQIEYEEQEIDGIVIKVRVNKPEKKIINQIEGNF